MSGSQQARVEIASGARATERRLLELAREHRAEVRRDPALLARPLRILVPSRSLRLHLGERLSSELGATAGIVLQTLHGAAVEILDRVGDAQRGADSRVDLIVRRLAAEDAVLRSAFEPFHDGYRTAVGAVRDLLDAGFEGALLEPVLERFAELRLSAPRRERATATLRLAAMVEGELLQRGVGGRSDLLRRAREAFDADPAGSLPTHALLVHGFADATGRASDLLASFLRRLPGIFLADQPPDPDEPGATDLGVVYTERLLERMHGVAAEVRRLDAPPAAVAPQFFRAPGAQAELREVARRARACLAAGVRPERIGVVARDLGPYRYAVRAQFARLGLPLSALRGRAPLDGEGRRIVALAELLDDRERTPADRWLDAVRRIDVEVEGESTPRSPSSRLRMGLRVVGAARLAEVAALDPAEHLEHDDRLRLPVRTGSRASDGEFRYRVAQARLPGAELRAAVRAAQALGRRLARWKGNGEASEHARRFERLRKSDLGWRSADRFERRVAAVVEGVVEGLGDEVLSVSEFLHALGRELLDCAAPPLGGSGGGVQVLDAMEARGRTFEHLFVVGMNRDLFPRVAGEEPLLGDDLRAALLDFLPDMPVRARARDEDRYLFAQLASCADEVVLSWQLADDEGRPRVVSPLVERLLRERDESEIEAAPPIFPNGGQRSDGPHTAHEHAVVAGLQGRRQALGACLPVALEAGGLAAPRAQIVAQVREAVVAAWDEGPFEPWRFAPWLGWLGPQTATEARPDPRREPSYITRLEAMSRCPWQMVLSKLLRLEEAPDPLDGLPAIEARAVGIVVHDVLERIAREGLDESAGNEWADVLQREPASSPWPDRERVQEILLDVVREHVRQDRVPLPGLVRSIAAVATPKLERARVFLEQERKRFGTGVLGVEVEGRAGVPLPDGAVLDVVFRADRVEQVGERVVLTDFKTGKIRASNRERELTSFRDEQMPRGRALQPIAYALAASRSASTADGRYLYLGGEGPGDESDEGPGAVDVGLATRFAEHVGDVGAAVGVLLDAWERGIFFPRVAEGPEERQPDACRFCDVAQACVLEDSGAKRAFLGMAQDGEASRDPAHRAFSALHQLAVARRQEDDE